MTAARYQPDESRSAAGARVALAALFLAAFTACARDDRGVPNDGPARPRDATSGASPAAAVAHALDAPPALDRPCEPDTAADAEIAAQASATIPLVVGLTLSNSWVPPKGDPDQYEHECLTQVTAVGRARVAFSMSCPAGERGDEFTRGTRQVCRADLRDGRLYRTSFGARFPDLQASTTSDVLSRRAFRELEQQGTTWFRWVELQYARGGTPPADDGSRPFEYFTDWVGPLDRTGTGTAPVVVNDRTVQLPVLLARGVLRRTPRDANQAGPPEPEVRLAVLDDERLPLVLDLSSPNVGASIRYTRITFPSRTAIERDLTEGRRAVLYGIYFAYDSAEIRPESEAVLREIAAVLARNADWHLRLEGHTDSIGGDSFNRDLSARRAEAVRQALVERYAIAAERLTTSGYGASVPRDRNSTPEGRARNRRVELVRD